jgi:hypothetical protein
MFNVLPKPWGFSSSLSSLRPSGLLWSDVNNRVREAPYNGNDITVTKRLGKCRCGETCSKSSCTLEETWCSGSNTPMCMLQ